MKRSVQLVILFISVIVLSSCSRQYAHLTRTKIQFAKQDQNKSEMKRTFRKIQDVPTRQVENHSIENSYADLNKGAGTVQFEQQKKKTISPKTTSELNRVKAPEELHQPIVQLRHKTKNLKKLSQPKVFDKKDSTNGRGILYTLLVILLVLIIIGLIRDLLGPALWSLIVLVALIALLGILLGWW